MLVRAFTASNACPSHHHPHHRKHLKPPNMALMHCGVRLKHSRALYAHSYIYMPVQMRPITAVHACTAQSSPMLEQDKAMQSQGACTQPGCLIRRAGLTAPYLRRKRKSPCQQENRWCAISAADVATMKLEPE